MTPTGLHHPSLPVLFKQRVPTARNDECWEWKGMRKETGYGRFKLRSGETVAAHRIAFFFANGEWPGDREVCHRCDNPPCCNPAHLFLGTHQENMTDRVGKGRAKHFAARGSRQHLAKLTDADVRAMRAKYRHDCRGDGILAAREYGLSRSTVSSILRGQTWSHVA